MQKITPFLWFDHQAEEAAQFYVSIFKNSKIGAIGRYSDVASGPKGSVMTVAFTLDGQEFTALNAGPLFHFTEAISFVVNCETQDEIDYYWDKLIAAGGKPSQCGWLKDKFGLSWQVVPSIIPRVAASNEPEKINRLMQAVLKMIKLDIATLQRACDEK